MSVGEPGLPASAGGRVSLWAIGLAGLLVAAGFGRQRAPAVQHRATRAAGSARSWWETLLRVYRGIADDRILANAAGVSFYALLALFPAVAALVSIYGVFADPQSIAEHLEAISGVFPGGAIDVIRDQLDRLAAQPRATLGLSFLIGLSVSLWSANGGVKALFDALNDVYEARERRSSIALTALSLAFTVGMLVFFLIALASLIALPVALGYLPSFTALVLNIARWPLLLVLVALALSLFYRYGPCHARSRWHWISWGGALAAVVWLAASALFSWYAGNFGSFNKTYGSLGAVIGFMMWMWLSVIVVLIGGKLNAEIERPGRDGSRGPIESTVAAAGRRRDSFGSIPRGCARPSCP